MAMDANCPWGHRVYADFTPPGVSRFNYHHLADDLKPAYRAMERGLTSGKPYFVVDKKHPDSWCSRVLNAVVYDNPFLCDVRQVTYVPTGLGTAVRIRHPLSTEETRDICQRMRRIAIEASVKTSDMTPYEKEIWVHDYLVDTVTYDMAAKNAFTAAGALVDGRAVCQGISMAALFLLNSLGVDTGMVTGSLNESPETGHGWNIVWLDGEYHLDVTHDITLGGNGRRVHFYVNQDDGYMGERRRWAPETVCRSVRYNYLEQNRSAIKDKVGLRLMLDHAVRSRTEWQEFSLSTEMCGKYGLEDLYDEVGASMRRNLRSGGCQVAFDPRTGFGFVAFKYGQPGLMGASV